MLVRVRNSEYRTGRNEDRFRFRVFGFSLFEWTHHHSHHPSRPQRLGIRYSRFNVIIWIASQITHHTSHQIYITVISLIENSHSLFSVSVSFSLFSLFIVHFSLFIVQLSAFIVPVSRGSISGSPDLLRFGVLRSFLSSIQYPKNSHTFHPLSATSFRFHLDVHLDMYDTNINPSLLIARFLVHVHNTLIP